MEDVALSQPKGLDAIDFDEIALQDVRYVIEYSHPLGSSPISILSGMVLSILEGNAGLGVAFVCFILVLAVIEWQLILILVAVLTFVLGLGYLVIAAIYIDTAVRVDGHGISFPSAFMFPLRFQLERHWTEIVAVKFANTTGNSVEDDRILIGFHDDTYVKFDIDGFSRSALKKLVLLINTYRPDIAIQSDFSDLLFEAEDRGDLKNELLEAASSRPKDRDKSINKKNALSFTKIWEAELNSRYGTTAYTPLECGESLQGDAYKVLGQIAFGGLSAIYLAEDENQQLIVLKESVLPESADQVSKEKAMEMFQREAQLLCTISHRNIAQVYDYFVEDDRHYMVLQYIDGRTIRDYIQEFGKQSEHTTIRWAIELASTLSYLHKLTPPVIHRDLTPDNLLIRKDGSITIIDFGAANNFLGTATCTVVGKSAYIPLEQFQGKARLCSDIYSFGATLFFVLTGRDPAPFSQSNPLDSGAMVSSELNNLILSCTAVKPDGRIESVDTLLERLGRMQKSKIR